ncbi:MAG: hypothetical protein GY867_03825 [bacterium]|nr:hypothetical protein [bacterium]
MGIDFGNLIQRSFKIAWQNKSLWVFGLFLWGGGGSYNLDTDKWFQRHRSDLGFDQWGQYRDLEHFFEEFAVPVIGIAVLVLLAFVLLMIICSLIAKPAMIDGVNNITRGGHYRFGSSFSRALDFFWRFLGLTVLGILTFMAFIVGIVLFAVVISPWTLLLTIPLFLLAGFFVWHTFELAQVAMVARDISLGDALQEGWTLLTRNLGNCFIMSLVQFGLGIAFFIVIGILTLMFFVPLNMMVGSMAGGTLGAIMLGFFIGLPVSVVLGGYAGTFFESLYIQFYFRLVEPAPAYAAPDPAAPGPMPQP